MFGLTLYTLCNFAGVFVKIIRYGQVSFCVSLCCLSCECLLKTYKIVVASRKIEKRKPYFGRKLLNSGGRLVLRIT